MYLKWTIVPETIDSTFPVILEEKNITYNTKLNASINRVLIFLWIILYADEYYDLCRF